MNIGILDCKVGGAYIEDVERYAAEGFNAITSSALDRPRQSYGILAATWTLLSEKRLRNVNCRAVVVKDNDEPENVIKQKTVDALALPKVKLIDNWGISTRVAWNRSQIVERAPSAQRVAIIANTPSHDALAEQLRADGLKVCYPMTPAVNGGWVVEYAKAADVVIVHLGKADFEPLWFDQMLDALTNTFLLISTTRGAAFSADAINRAIERGAVNYAVLDWAWQQNKLAKNGRIILTNHTSYRSEQSKKELTDVTIKAVKELCDGID